MLQKSQLRNSATTGTATAITTTTEYSPDTQWVITNPSKRKRLVWINRKMTFCIPRETERKMTICIPRLAEK